MRGDEQKPDTRCGTTRDELARDNEVLHPQWGVRYTSGVYASTVLCLTGRSATRPVGTEGVERRPDRVAEVSRG